MTDKLKIITDKFLSWDPDCKDWSFTLIEETGCVEITLPILDRHNDYVQLYCRIYKLNETFILFEITDDGFIDNEYAEMALHSLFKEKELKYYCYIEHFKQGMDYYFDAFRCAGSQIGFSKLLDREGFEKIDKGFAELEEVFKKNRLKSTKGEKRILIN